MCVCHWYIQCHETVVGKAPADSSRLWFLILSAVQPGREQDEIDWKVPKQVFPRTLQLLPLEEFFEPCLVGVQLPPSLRRIVCRPLNAGWCIPSCTRWMMPGASADVPNVSPDNGVTPSRMPSYLGCFLFSVSPVSQIFRSITCEPCHLMVDTYNRCNTSGRYCLVSAWSCLAVPRTQDSLVRRSLQNFHSNDAEWCFAFLPARRLASRTASVV